MENKAQSAFGVRMPLLALMATGIYDATLLFILKTCLLHTHASATLPSK